MGKMELAGTLLLPSSFARLLAGPVEKNPVMHELKQPKLFPVGQSAVAQATPQDECSSYICISTFEPNFQGEQKHTTPNEMTPC